MKIVIDIDEKNYKSVMLTQNRPIGQRLPYGLSDTIKNGTILPKGHWIKIGAYQGKCSCCNNCVIDEDENFGDYCRHCGAEMESD